MTGRIIIGALAALAVTAPSQALAAKGEPSPRSFKAATVPVPGGELHVRDHPGPGPAIVLMHGFPDNLHLYDRVVPRLRGHRVITFDFLGWGRSDKPRRHDYTFPAQVRELDAVLSRLGAERVVLVAHDASGPAAINWALDHQDRVAGLVLLNTFYGLSARAKPPEMITVFADPAFRDLAAAFAADRRAFTWAFRWQVSRFMTSPTWRRRMVARFVRQFAARRSSVPPLLELNRDLFGELARNTARQEELRSFAPPVTIAFGEDDPYLNTAVAAEFVDAFGDARFERIRGRHYVQVDAPERVARLLADAAEGPSPG
jgi:haloalkane dehalogenase